MWQPKKPVQLFLANYLKVTEEWKSIHELGHKALTSGALLPESAARSWEVAYGWNVRNGKSKSKPALSKIIEAGARREVYRAAAVLRDKGILESSGKRGNTMYRLIKENNEKA